MPKNLRKAIQVEKAEASLVPPRFEWLFRHSEVPDDELVACTCWEYLREVPPDKFGPTGISGYARRLLISYRSHEAQRKFNDSFDRIPSNILLVLARNLDLASELQPWQRLDPNLRQRLNQPMPKAWKALIELDVIANGLISWGLKMPDPGPFKVPRALAESELEVYAFALAHEARRTLPLRRGESQDKLPAIPRSTKYTETDGSINDFSLHDPRSWLIPYASNELASPVPFLINWGEYTSEEIVAAFRDWVEKARPRFTPTPRGKGTRVTDLRGALRDLGALRIMKAMPADEFIARHDEEYHLFQKPWDGRKCKKRLPTVDLTNLRGRAIDHFQNLFALDSATKPRSWQKRRTKKRTLTRPIGDLPDFKAKHEE